MDPSMVVAPSKRWIFHPGGAANWVMEAGLATVELG